MDWTAGYVTDVEYGAHYFPELNPGRLPIALINAGYAPPEIRTACELGFGQGVSLNVHAAMNPEIEWHGNDFNPAHVAYARRLAEEAGLRVHLSDQSFAEYFARDDLPDFDLISLHGVWSWVSDENRALIVDFIHRKLRVGGVVYVSYNCLPGWAPFMPMRQMFFDHGRTLSPPALDSESKVEAALNYVRRVFDTAPAYVKANPGVAPRLKLLQDQPRPYLAHEYFNAEWRPMYFSEVADALGQAKLGYACSIHYLDLVGQIWLTPEQQALLAETPSVSAEQTLRDYMVNQQFRRDIWIKGATPLPMRERLDAMRACKVVLLKAADAVALQVDVNGRKIDLQERIYRPLLQALSSQQPMTLGELEAATAKAGLTLLQVIEAVVVLIGAEVLAPANTPSKAAREATARLNQVIGRRAEASTDMTRLVSPLTGPVPNMDQISSLMAIAYGTGARTSDDIAAAVWKVLQAENRRLVRKGETLETSEQNIAELKQSAEVFLKERATILSELGVFDDLKSAPSRHNVGSRNR